MADENKSKITEILSKNKETSKEADKVLRELKSEIDKGTLNEDGISYDIEDEYNEFKKQEEKEKKALESLKDTTLIINDDLVRDVSLDLTKDVSAVKSDTKVEVIEDEIIDFGNSRDEAEQFIKSIEYETKDEQDEQYEIEQYSNELNELFEQEIENEEVHDIVSEQLDFVDYSTEIENEAELEIENANDEYYEHEYQEYDAYRDNEMIHSEIEQESEMNHYEVEQDTESNVIVKDYSDIIDFDRLKSDTVYITDTDKEVGSCGGDYNNDLVIENGVDINTVDIDFVNNEYACDSEYSDEYEEEYTDEEYSESYDDYEYDY